MSVLINDFEIIPDDPESEAEDDRAPESTSDRAGSPSLRPHDVIDIVEAEHRRRRRLRAH
jgi:hypothetical protein